MGLDFSGQDYEKRDIEVKGPDGKPYLLVEADGAAARQFKSARASCIRGFDLEGDSKKITEMRGMGDLEPLLVSLCLWRMSPDGKDKIQKIDKRILEKWSSRVIKPLYDWVIENSELDEKDDGGSVKNSQENSMGGSESNENGSLD